MYLNKDKSIFSAKQGLYLQGFNYHHKFPTPANRTDLQSFFGLVNHLSFSTDAVAELLVPLHPLHSTKNEFLWSSEHDQAFTKAKEHLFSRSTNSCIF